MQVTSINIFTTSEGTSARFYPGFRWCTFETVINMFSDGSNVFILDILLCQRHANFLNDEGASINVWISIQRNHTHYESQFLLMSCRKAESSFIVDAVKCRRNSKYGLIAGTDTSTIVEPTGFLRPHLSNRFKMNCQNEQRRSKNKGRNEEYVLRNSWWTVLLYRFSGTRQGRQWMEFTGYFLSTCYMSE